MREFETRWLKLPEVQVVGLQQVKNTLVSLVATAQTMIAAVAAIAVIVALIGVINTILMSVYERTSGDRHHESARRPPGRHLPADLAGDGHDLPRWRAAGSVLAIVGSGLVEKAIKALADLGVSGSVVRITPAVVGYACSARSSLASSAVFIRPGALLRCGPSKPSARECNHARHHHRSTWPEALLPPR